MIIKNSTWKFLIHVFLYIILVNHVYAQKLFKNNSDNKINEFNFSLYTGYSLFGPQSGIESNMSSSGLDDLTQGGWFGDPSEHPFTNKFPTLDIEASYFYYKRSGVSLNIGLGDFIEVHGYEDIGIGNFMFLKSIVYSISLSHVYRTENEKHNIFLGPALLVHKVKDTSAGMTSPASQKLKPGVYIGYEYQFLQKKYWFITFKSNLRLAPQSEIGPLIAQHQLGIATDNPETFASEFSSTKVNLICLNLGISAGFKIFK